jgi:dihydrofolate reductase
MWRAGPDGREQALGTIKVHEFTTVDGVVDVPTWTVDYGFPDDLAASIGAITGTCSGILLGRTTYQMFAPAWSSRTAEDDPGAPFFNDTTKHVVSSTLTAADADWSNSHVLGGYDADRLRRLADESEGDLYVSGSATLVRAMLADRLVGELHLYVYPLAVGSGLRLFPDGGPAVPLALLGCERLSNGVAHLTYGPPPGG